jgi:ribosomal-protein-serine acetyltransferase
MNASHEEFIISTTRENVYLKRFSLADAAAIFAIIDEGRSHLSQFDDETAKKYEKLSDLEESIRNPKNPHRLRLSICDGNQIIGSINLTPDYPPEAEVGYWLGERYKGRGYATLALNAITNHARSRDYRFLYALVTPGNDNSSAVLLRGGYADHGEHLVNEHGEWKNRSVFTKIL